jgi:hypothetical protein
MPKVLANRFSGFLYERILRELDIHPQGYPQKLGIENTKKVNAEISERCARKFH